MTILITIIGVTLVIAVLIILAGTYGEITNERWDDE